MMTRRTRLTVIGLIILFLLLLILLLLWFLFGRKAAQETKSIEIEPIVEEITTEQPTLKEQQLKEEQDTRNQSASAIAVAKMFVERYGSYSNEANFQNLKDVLPLMTDSFAQWTNQFIVESTQPGTYYGVTTSVLIVKVEKMDDVTGIATILLNTQQEIAENSPQNTRIEYKEIRLELERVDDVWKVDSALWL